MKIVFYIALLFIGSNLRAQLTSAPVYPEKPNPKSGDKAKWEGMKPNLFVGFGSADVRYKKEEVPGISLEQTWKTKGWKGEIVHTQFLIATTRPLQQVRLEWNELKSNAGNRISRDSITANFVRYVLTDSLSRQGMGCGIETDLDSSLAPDVIDKAKQLDIAAQTTQPVWLRIHIPYAVPAGVYRGRVTVFQDKDSLTSLQYSVEVLNRALPQPKHWAFHLDLWQNPFSVARIHGVTNWSDQHMELLAPYMKMLAAAGQKVITASIIHDPWNSQTYDVYGSMVRWIKKREGTWRYDYAVFDKWVSYMIAHGINKKINCYSMIPWNLKFYYYDEAAGKDTFLVANPGTAAYEQHWRPMLADFAQHLKEKGWFEKTTIAMDERPMQHMQMALAVIKSADKNFRVSMAGEYHKELEKELADYSVASKFVLPNEILSRRKKDGFVTTYYTACPEAYPNTFTFSPPAEAAFLGWYAAAKGFDGYLRWAFNSWPQNPLQDSRFGTWSGGDTYFVYPGSRSSIRFERLIEGIQAYEKVQILKMTFLKSGETKKLVQLNQLLQTFEIANIKKTGAASLVGNATRLVNAF